MRIAQSDMRRELIAELSTFEVNYILSGNLTLDVGAREHHGDLAIGAVVGGWPGRRTVPSSAACKATGDAPALLRMEIDSGMIASV